MALYMMLREQSGAEFCREGSWNRQGERQPDPTDFWHCQTKQEEKSDSYWHYSCRSLTALSSQKHMTVEHCRDSRDAKNMNLDDPQPEGKARNLALIFLCENFPAVSTITVRVGPQKLVQQVLKFCSVLHSTMRPSAITHALRKAKLISEWWKNEQLG